VDYKGDDDKYLQKKIKDFIELGRTLGYWTHGYDFPRYCKQVFKDIDLKGKNILEIGCGKGLFCIWASIHCASHVIGLEPLEDGSFDSSKIYSEFKKIVNTLKLNNVNIISNRIEDYQSPNISFDIVVSLASINHLDEHSCIRLKESDTAKKHYRDIFLDIASKMNNYGTIIVMDCSNRNFFSDIGLTNPMAKSIEWFKHQDPEFWAKILSECGFADPKITWPSGRYLRYMRIYNRNKLLSYFTDSAFRLEMTRIKS
jgi:cyclopropane fatty-acyl-phospholipid synthase-like methyltransferase